jgi:signal transduction histidine kinase
VLAALAAFDVAAVVFAGLVGWFVSSRLTRPVRALRDDAIRLGDGDFSVEPRRSGVGEIDATAAALAETAGRLGETVRREREFSANASHQLRTPIASLRLLLESELEQPSADRAAVAEAALADVDRLQSTLDTMLDVARGTRPSRSPVDLADWSSGLSARSDLGTGSGRRLEIACSCDRAVNVSRAVLDQIADILLTNAVRHGRGTITVDVACTDGRVVVTVADEGRVERDSAELFRRGDPDAAGHGVGLALARSLAEGEGGRLVLQSADPTSFRVWLPAPPAPAAHP